MDQKQLKQFLARRHPEYHGMVDHWDFLEATYEGGRDWFNKNLFTYIKEGETEFRERVKRAYRFNHTREVVDLVGKYLFKMEISRNEADAPDWLKRFWKQATLSKRSITDFMKRVENRGSVFGRVWIVVDSTKTAEIRTRAEELAADARVYAYIVTPQNALDFAYDSQGNLNWILFHEIQRDDEDPFTSSGEQISRYRLWTKHDSQVFIARKQGNKVVIEAQDPVVHNLGVVPVFAHDSVISDEPYTSPSLIADVAYLDRAVANYLSNLDAIIQDQTFSQLAMPAQSVPKDTEARDQLLEMGTKRVFLYDGDSTKGPEYISPDVKQAELILKVINKIINEIYHSVGLAGERTKEDNALGIDNSSGVAKAYDFERVNSLLISKADSLEATENRLVWLVGKWNGDEKTIEAHGQPFVHYPDNFDVRGLYDEFEIAARLSLIEAPEEVRRTQMEKLIDKLFPQLKKELREKMLRELKTWPPKPEPLVAPSENPLAEQIKKDSKNALANKLVKGGE